MAERLKRIFGKDKVPVVGNPVIQPSGNIVGFVRLPVHTGAARPSRPVFDGAYQHAAHALTSLVGCCEQILEVTRVPCRGADMYEKMCDPYQPTIDSCTEGMHRDMLLKLPLGPLVCLSG